MLASNRVEDRGVVEKFLVGAFGVGQDCGEVVVEGRSLSHSDVPGRAVLDEGLEEVLVEGVILCPTREIGADDTLEFVRHARSLEEEKFGLLLAAAFPASSLVLGNFYRLAEGGQLGLEASVVGAALDSLEGLLQFGAGSRG